MFVTPDASCQERRPKHAYSSGEHSQVWLLFRQKSNAEHCYFQGNRCSWHLGILGVHRIAGSTSHHTSRLPSESSWKEAHQATSWGSLLRRRYQSPSSSQQSKRHHVHVLPLFCNPLQALPVPRHSWLQYSSPGTLPYQTLKNTSSVFH